MIRRPMVVTDNRSLRSCFKELQRGDVVVGRVSCRPHEEYLLFDLLDRGVYLIPSGLSQAVCRSKVFQTRVFGEWMLPNTVAVHDIHQLQEVMQEASNYEYGVVSKLDRKNAGLGVHRWNSLEDVFNQASLGTMPYPFVVQPYMPNCRDIRVVFLGDYVEAYWRHNQKNFRNNIHFGAVSEVCELTDLQLNICREVMERGKFPYAHIDLMVTEGNQTFLVELNLRGGIKGAQITPAQYSKRLKGLHDVMLEEVQSSF